MRILSSRFNLHFNVKNSLTQCMLAQFHFFNVQPRHYLSVSRSLWLVVTLYLLSACASLPPAIPVTEPIHHVTTTNSQLAQVIHSLRQDRQNLTGIYPLSDSHDSFAARANLIHSAEFTLDLQYYIWHNDTSGRLLAQALQRAANRGVKVRLLLDDNNTDGLDYFLSDLDAHPNIQVRLFNPFHHRKMRWMGYITQFERLNHRMHNKAFIVDQQAAILGGRNIGDEYFGAGDGTMFIDLDVLAVGKVVDDINQDFERYWRSESSYPLQQVLQHRSVAPLPATLNEQEQQEQNIKKINYIKQVAQSDYANALREQRLPLQWSDVTLVSDDPAKALQNLGATPTHNIVTDLSRELGDPKAQLLIVSPYFVPTKNGTKELVQLAQNGIGITILTNSLAATDVTPVHAGYAKYRKPLLKAGINLYELKPSIIKPMIFKDRGLTGSSGSSLHAKTIAIDNRSMFIGSFNMDPRSANVNTENGVVIHNPQLTSHFKETLLNNVPSNAYEVQLDSNGRLVWLEHGDHAAMVYQKEPQTTWLKRFWIRFLAILPIEPLL